MAIDKGLQTLNHLQKIHNSLRALAEASGSEEREALKEIASMVITAASEIHESIPDTSPPTFNAFDLEVFMEAVAKNPIIACKAELNGKTVAVLGIFDTHKLEWVPLAIPCDANSMGQLFQSMKIYEPPQEVLTKIFEEHMKEHKCKFGRGDA